MIEKFLVKGLFGLFDNEIVFRESGITVIVGKNGCGKTTMLHMLNAIFSKNHSQLLQYEFDYIELSISNHVLRIEPIIEYSEAIEINMKSLKYYIDSQVLEKRYEENNKFNSATNWARWLPFLRRRPGNLLYDIRKGQVLTVAEAMNAYFDDLVEYVKEDIIPIPQEVYGIIKDLQVDIITTDRLKKLDHDDEYGRYEFVQKYAVEECAKELSDNLKNELSLYANISQKLDEKFPSKILENLKQCNPISEIDLKNKIYQIDELRKKHVRAGVLEENNDKFLNINVDQVDKNTATILNVYYDDMKIKLESLNNISDRIVLFRNMISNKFSINKEINIDKDNGIIVTKNPKGEKITLSSLSSGEQQELLLLYKLIFKGEKEKLILIDEPEISLNVSWQREFLDDMKQIVEINGFSILIATHSPQIINDNWDLVETIGELDK